jgi:hypothetical protein
MAFITNASGNVISFAEYTDVLQKDQRVFEANELVIPAESGFLTIQEFVENMLEKGTNRILLKLKASSWWRNYCFYAGIDYDINNIPNVNPDNIDPGNTLGRQQQFSDMSVYYTCKEYIFPLIADFGNEESAGVAKIKYYEDKFNQIFEELTALSDWYDADGDGVIQTDEKATYYQQVRRSRRRTNIVVVK